MPPSGDARAWTSALARVSTPSSVGDALKAAPKALYKAGRICSTYCSDHGTGLGMLAPVRFAETSFTCSSQRSMTAAMFMRPTVRNLCVLKACMRSVGGSGASVVDEEGLSSSAASLSIFRIFTLLLTVQEAFSMFIALAAAPHLA